MPYQIRKLPNSNKYRLINSETKRIHAYRTTLKKAQAQKRLLLSKEKS
jgi:hypothetical protein